MGQEKIGRTSDRSGRRHCRDWKVTGRVSSLGTYPEKFEAADAAIVAAKNALSAADEALTEAIALATEGAGEALTVLETGRDYLHTHPTLRMPLVRQRREYQWSGRID